MIRSSFISCNCLLALLCFPPVANSFQPPAPKPVSVTIRDCPIILNDHRLLASGQSGLLWKVFVKEGDEVARGDILAELEDSEARARQQIAVVTAENDIDVRYAELAAKVAENEYQSVARSNSIRAETFAAIEVEKIRLERDRSQLQILVATHEQKLNQLRVKEADAVLKSYRIEAPIDGLITRIFKKPGEAVQPGETVLELKQTNVVRVEVELGIEHLGRVRRGANVKVHPTVLPPGKSLDDGPLEGKVFFIDLSVEPVSRTVRMLVEVDNRERLLLPGLTADVEIP